MAFPTTSVLDAFNRANEDPLSGGGNWATLAFASGPMRLVSNAANGHSGSGSSSYWTPTSFGPDTEVWATLSQKWTTDGAGPSLTCNLQTPTVSASGYLLTMYGSTGDVVEIYRIDNAVPTLLGASITSLTVTVGDKFGLENISGSIKLYQNSSGSWTLRATRTDSTYGAGKLGLGADNAESSWDDYGGGTYVPPVGSTPAAIVFRNRLDV